jgi:predicted Fe-S protein YdhL (DUF1289 family)
MDSSRRPDSPAPDWQQRASQDSAGPMSPCVSICTLDAQGVCRGCFRTLAEISGWLRMTAEERRAVLHNSDLRRASAGA